MPDAPVRITAIDMGEIVVLALIRQTVAISAGETSALRRLTVMGQQPRFLGVLDS